MSSRLPSSDKDSLRKQSDQGGGGCCGGSKKKENYSDSLAVSKDQHDSSRGNRPSQKVDLSRGAKVVFLGEAGVGKSSIVGRYVKNQFDEHQPPTVG